MSPAAWPAGARRRLLTTCWLERRPLASLAATTTCWRASAAEPKDRSGRRRILRSRTRPHRRAGRCLKSVAGTSAVTASLVLAAEGDELAVIEYRRGERPPEALRRRRRCLRRPGGQGSTSVAPATAWPAANRCITSPNVSCSPGTIVCGVPPRMRADRVIGERRLAGAGRASPVAGAVAAASGPRGCGRGAGRRPAGGRARVPATSRGTRPARPRLRPGRSRACGRPPDRRSASARSHAGSCRAGLSAPCSADPDRRAHTGCQPQSDGPMGWKKKV